MTPKPAPGQRDETSGSLTGFILSRGRAEGTRPRTRPIVVGLVLLLMIAALIVLGLFAVRAIVNTVLG